MNQIQEESVLEKKQMVQRNIGNLLANKDPLLTERSFKSKILDQLNSFHQFYHHRYEEMKQNYEKTKQTNWQYTAKILKYEQMLENNQSLLNSAKIKLQKFENSLLQSQLRQKKLNDKMECITKQKNEEIGMLQCMIKSLNMQNNKKKLIRLKQKNKDTINQTQKQNMKTQRQHQNLKQRNSMLEQQVYELQQENQMYKRKLKHHETDRKYEDQRIKSATLSLELDLKIKEEQIGRLTHQISVYQNKFKEILASNQDSNTGGIDDIGKKIQMIDTDQEITQAYWASKNQANSARQQTQKKIGIPNNIAVKQDTKKYQHRRHTSWNHGENRSAANQDLNMKVRVFKYDKNRKYL